MSVIKGLLVESVSPGGTADSVGLKKGDYLIRYNDSATTTNEELSQAISSNQDVATITILRSDQEIQFTVASGKLGATLKPSIHFGSSGSNNSDSARNTDSTFLINILSFFAWLSLLVGIAGSIVLFNTLGFEVINYKTHYNVIGIVASVAVALQGLFAFALFQVIAVMALEIKAIKNKLRA